MRVGYSDGDLVASGMDREAIVSSELTKIYGSGLIIKSHVWVPNPAIVLGTKDLLLHNLKLLNHPTGTISSSPDLPR